MSESIDQLSAFLASAQARRVALQKTTVERRKVLESLAAVKTQLSVLQEATHKTRATATEALRSSIDSIAGRLTEVSRQIPVEITDLRGDVEELQSAFKSLQQNWQQRFEEVTSNLEEAVSTWEETVDAIAEEIPEEAGEALTELRGRIESELQDAADGIVEETRERVTEILTESQAMSKNALDAMQQRIEGTLQDIIERAQTRLRDGMRGLVDRFIERAIGETMSEISKSLMTAQAAVSAAASTSPLTPQIITLRPLVGAVKSIMDSS